MKPLVLVTVLLFSVLTFAKKAPSAASDDVLITKEHQKWAALSKGGDAALFQADLADQFVSIGYQPDGSVAVSTMAQIRAHKEKFPPAEFKLSEFRVIHGGPDTAVITYIAEMQNARQPFKLRASSVWTRTKAGWKTIFYQATLTK